MRGMKWRINTKRWRGFMSWFTGRNTRQEILTQVNVPAGAVDDVHEIIERARG